MTVTEAIQALQQAGASMRCSKLQKILESLGFEVRDGRKQGHKVVTHPDLEEFFSASYTCGHGKDPEVKRNYVRSMLALLKRYRQDLQKIMEDRAR
jgi:predicted RNA binding protein YcfA (HicA-like mRNA interferase family)